MILSSVTLLAYIVVQDNRNVPIRGSQLRCHRRANRRVINLLLLFFKRNRVFYLEQMRQHVIGRTGAP